MAPHRRRALPHLVMATLPAWLPWLLALAVGFTASRVGGALLARHHGDRYEIAGVLLVAAAGLGGLILGRGAPGAFLTFLGLACAAGLFDGYRTDDGVGGPHVHE